MNYQVIKRSRKSLHMTQAELAEKLGVNRATISKYETGAITPSLKSLQGLAKVLTISVGKIIEE